ncbi:MAG: FAD-binding oxidoreductase, partial [Deltaproteobacteria bacterium]|nr:FAD-binding oxidoreductase [Deltaproteobacteria bacterium]
MALPPSLLHTLARTVGERHLVVEPEQLVPYSHDETPDLAPVMPEAVVRPASSEEVAAVLRACSAERVAVVPRGGG